MSTTPAAQLARVKVAHPGWSIRRIGDGKGVGFTAQQRLERGRLRSIYAPTLPELERRLAEAEADGSARRKGSA